MTPNKEYKSEYPCPYCGEDENYYYVWESSDEAYEDYHHTCRACGKDWWVDGCDS